MKKIIASAIGLMLAGGIAATTACAVESQFGGYWRTRFDYDNNMTGTDATATTAADNNTDSRYITDTRTRLYYTAKFNDNFKFVNKFEFNTVWGDDNGGDIAADGVDNWKIKNSYVDFTLGQVKTKVGIQGGTISRGFIFADDFSGVTVAPEFGAVKVPVIWMSSVDEEARGNTDGNQNIFSVMPEIQVSEMLTLTPHLTYQDGNDQNTGIYWLGVDADLKLDAVSGWFTGIYNGGQVDDNDVSAYLLAIGADAGIVHGQAFYASGDDDAADTDHDEFQSAPGQSYYWSEIMGLGIFDDRASNGSPKDHISNVWAANVGVTVKPMDKLTAGLDVWYASLAENNAHGDSDLGLEFDGLVSYELMDNLNADFVLAYLVAGDATGDDDIIEGGMQLSLKF